MPAELMHELDEIMHSRQRLKQLRVMRKEVAERLVEVFKEVGIDMTCAEHLDFDDSKFTR